MRRALVPVLLASCLAPCPRPTAADWVPHGTGICTVAPHQTVPVVAADGAGGALIVWRDGRTPDFVYAQHMDPSGDPVWAANGVRAFQGHTSVEEPMAVVSDGAGGAIITAQNASGVLAQRLGPTGGPMWTTDGIVIGGVPVGGGVADRGGPLAVTDGAGGAIIVWKDRRNSPNYAVFAQRVDASGVEQWTATGIPLGALASNLIRLDVQPDGAGGAVVCWTDNAAHKAIAQRVTSSGSLLWGSGGTQVCPSSAFQYFAAILPTSAGGATVAWMDFRTGSQDIYAQQLSASGALNWTATGVPVCVQPGQQGPPFLTDDGAGGTILVWQDPRAGADIGIYAQRLTGAGAELWVANGVAAYTPPSWRQLNAVVSDGAGGAIAVWDDQRNDAANSIDVYAGRISNAGVATWPADGVALSSLPEGQYNVTAASDGAGGVIGAWNDFRNATIDIYAQRVMWDGTIAPYVWPKCFGDTEPAILTLIGSFVSTTSTVTLEKSGQTLTGGAPVLVGIDTYEVEVDVTGVELGDWTLTVDTPGYGITTFPDPVCVEPLIKPTLLLEFLGPSVARPSTSVLYTPSTENLGNVTSDGYGVLSFDVPAAITSVDVLFRNQLLATITPTPSPYGGALGCFTVRRIPANGWISDYVLRFDTPATAGALGCVRAALYQIPEDMGIQAGKVATLAVRDGGVALGFTWPAPVNAFFTGQLRATVGVEIIGLLQSFAADPVGNVALARHEELIRQAVDGALAQLAASYATDVTNYEAVWTPMKQPANWEPFRARLQEHLAAQTLSPASLMARWPSAPSCIPLEVVASVDPNDKYGAPGPSSAHFISGVDPLPYSIHFENLATATAPAQSVTITDALDPVTMDLESFMFTGFGFANHTVQPPRGLGFYTTDVDLRPAQDLIVRITGRLEYSDGTVSWTFVSIDPATGLPTTDPQAGFLPPNVTAPEGEGFVSFTVDPLPGLISGTVIANQADIVFDANPAISTPVYVNTIENTPPTSQVGALPMSQDSTSFTVTWSGSDAESGIESFTILVSEDGTTYEAWIGHTTATAALFPGVAGRNYSFYSVARNGVGMTESPPASADAITGVGGATGVVPPSFLSTWGVLGTGAGEFDQPEALAIDDEGSVFVADLAAHRVQAFTTGGEYLLEWGSGGAGPGEFNAPSGVDATSGLVYVTDYLNHRVQVFNEAGSYLSEWGGPGAGDGQFDRPDGVAVDAAGTVYVADSYNHRIQRFSAIGAYLGQWGTVGSGDGHLLNPAGVAIDAQGDVYVSDANNHRVQKFTADGTFLTAWGSYGTGPGQFDTPQGLAVDATDNVYVADFFNHRIQEFTPQGAFVTQWGTHGSGPGQFDGPSDVVVDGLFHVFVTDLGNHRVQKFGRGTFTDVVPGAPERLAFAAHPNPARRPVLSFDLPQAARVRLDVYDVQGRRRATLVDGELPAGRHARAWSGETSDGAGAGPGVYFYRLRAGRETRTVRGVRIE